MIFFSVHNPINVNMAGSVGYGSSDPSIPNILCLVPHILKENDIQRQQAGILRERAEGVHGTGRGRTHMLYSDFSGHGTETSK